MATLKNESILALEHVGLVCQKCWKAVTLLVYSLKLDLKDKYYIKLLLH